MSVRIMSKVFDADMESTKKFILLAYADHADHAGGNIFPAVATIAKKTGYSERTVQRITRQLEDDKILISDGTGRHGTNKWKIDIDAMGDTVSPVTTATDGGDVDDTEGVTDNDTRIIIKPSVKPSENSCSKQADSTFGNIMDRYLTISGKTYPKNPGSFIKAIKELVEIGVTPDDLEAGYKWRKDNGYSVGHPGQLRDSANRARLERINKIKPTKEDLNLENWG